ncbi:hypothetical protein JW758_05540 [Candidatus Peregrinibacteria bacterium]|nr:hypothetical protein [Candidatus Peregrinibacteria bacterium]
METHKESISIESMSSEEMLDIVRSLRINSLNEFQMRDKENFSNNDLAEILIEAENVCREIFRVYPINSKTTKDEIDSLQRPIENYLMLVTRNRCARGGQQILDLLEALTGISLSIIERWAEETRRRESIAEPSRDRISSL